MWSLRLLSAGEDIFRIDRVESDSAIQVFRRALALDPVTPWPTRVWATLIGKI
jgi:hypothetical protein